MTFTAGFLRLIWVVISILVNGIALTHYFTKLRGLELVGYGAAAAVAADAVVGLAIAAVPKGRWVSVAMLLALTLVSGVYFLLSHAPQELFLAFSRSIKIALVFWGCFLVLSLALFHVDIHFPEPLAMGVHFQGSHH